MEKHVLVILPHPDDEAFGVSGTIALYREQGTPVTYVCCTLGEMGRNMGNPPIANRETLPFIRKKELLNAAKAIDITDLRMLGLRDKTLEFEDIDELANRFRSIIEEVKPSLVITFYPGYAVHPDHDATGFAVVHAIKQMPEETRPKLHCLAFSHDCVEKLGEPDVVIDVTPVRDKKIACILAHETQASAVMDRLPEKLLSKNPEIMKWVSTERFWTYKF
ncbi:bacillithiol biosynthesis deacetylase BshB2 [Calidifontibacillus erzurumensis]|uniref:Bacillithiol biosynthesis deacetylase BshB2 n=1 Tax=Calidifontibacillus erzurumensis TaxID=2741433 RepID=A0A8J8K7N2_9BACI|nr:bacillithiol biosynthesis deacetylase BshB2 [Calidifontibacillus erzurumensis]NSL50946.1 bacillithiol biosynthesis deacetylase BshB2 [Calidifontibacillus erzurumensis]